MEKGFRFATDFKHPCLPSAEVKTFYASTLPITTFPLPDHSLGANRGYMDPGCCKQEDVQGTSEGGRGCWSCCSHFGTLRHLSSLRPASGVPSGLTVDSGCSLTAARWQVETQREDTIDEPGGGSSPDAKSALAGISDLQPPGRPDGRQVTPCTAPQGRPGRWTQGGDQASDRHPGNSSCAWKGPGGQRAPCRARALKGQRSSICPWSLPFTCPPGTSQEVVRTPPRVDHRAARPPVWM
ncbi:uncharacterized protein [Kogia breviceps]|uniref:uncharacterized protein isoform X3 n=1 Tax=Kogia breviceps TaxID=27615 RepID=UPI0034D301DE